MANWETDLAEMIVLLLGTAALLGWIHFSLYSSVEALALAASLHVLLIGYVVYTLRKKEKKR